MSAVHKRKVKAKKSSKKKSTKKKVAKKKSAKKKSTKEAIKEAAESVTGKGCPLKQVLDAVCGHSCPQASPRTFMDQLPRVARTRSRTTRETFNPQQITRLAKWDGKVGSCRHCGEKIVPDFFLEDCWTHVNAEPKFDHLGRYLGRTCTDPEPESDMAIISYRAGQRFRNVETKEEYILAQVGCRENKTGIGGAHGGGYQGFWSLICLSSGRCWYNVIGAGHTSDTINEECFHRVINGSEQDFEALPFKT